MAYYALTGNWGTAGTWSNSDGGASNGLVPDATIDVIFTNSSGAVTIDGTAGSPSLCRDFSTTGGTGYANTLTHAAAKELDVYGSMTLNAGCTYAPAATSITKFKSTATGKTITTAGKRMGPITVDGVGGGWQLQDALDPAAAIIGVTLVNGALDLNGKNVGATSGTGFLRSGTATASLTMGTMTWVLGTTQTWDASSSTGFTLSAANATITAASTTQNNTFAGGGLTYGTLTETTPTGAGGLSITGSNSFSTLTLSMADTAKTIAAGYTFEAGTTQTVSGTYTADGNSAILRNFVRSSVPGTAATINAATVAVTHTDFRDITGGGAGSWDFSGLTTTANGDCGGNTGITFTAPKNCYAKTAISRNWDAAFWYTTSGGSTAIVPQLPLVHDVAIFDANSVTAGSKTITSTQCRHPSMNWTGVANTPAFAHGAAAREWYGSVVFSSGMTHTGGGQVTLMGRGSHDFDGGGLTWPSPGWILNTPTGTYTQRANFLGATSVAFTFTAGTWVGGSYTFTLGSTAANLVFNGSATVGLGATTLGTGSAYTTTSATGTHTLGGTLTLPSAAFAISSGTLDMNGNTITGHSTAAISGTAVLNLSGLLNCSSGFSTTGGTINDSGAAGEIVATSITFGAGTHAVRKLTGAAISFNPSSVTTLNPGTYTHTGNWAAATSATSVTYNGTVVDAAGVLTITAAGGGAYAGTGGLQQIECGMVRG